MADLPHQGGQDPAIPSPPAKTFAALFADAANDPLQGRFAAVNALMGTYNNASYLAAVTSASVEQAPSLVGLATDEAHPNGVVKVFVGVHQVRPQFGLVSPNDNKIIAIGSEPFAGGVPQGVELLATDFAHPRQNNHPVRVPTAAHGLELLQADPAGEVLGPFGDEDVEETQLVRSYYLFPAPFFLLPLLWGRDLTPRQAFLECVPAIQAANAMEDCSSFVNWLLMAVTRRAQDNPPSVARQVFRPLVLNAELSTLLQTHTFRLLPGLARRETVAQDPALAAMARAVSADAEARLAEERRKASATSKKTLEGFYTQALLDHIQCMSRATSQDQLQAIFTSLAECPKNQQRSVVEAAFAGAARALNCMDARPIVTADLATKVVQFKLGGHQLDDFAEGIHPLSLMVRDERVDSLQAETDAAEKSAQAYDAVTGGGLALNLQDHLSLNKSSKASLPTDWYQVAQRLKAFHVVLFTLFGEDHEVVVKWKKLADAFGEKPLVYGSYLRHFGPLAPVYFLRSGQLLFLNWVRDVEDQGRYLEPPDFAFVLDKMRNRLFAWVPTLPASMVIVGGPKSGKNDGDDKSTGTGSTGSMSTISSDGSASKSSGPPQLRIVNVDFDEDFLKVKDTRGTLASFMKVKDKWPANGPYCLSYHLKGFCNSGCKRLYDHKPLSAARKAHVQSWIKDNLEFPSSS